MCDAATSYCTLGDVTDTNVETLPENTPPNTRFRYIDLSAVEAGAINWSAVTETTFGAAPSRARRVLKSLDVLFGTVRPNRKSHGFIGPDNPGPFIASTGFSVVCGRDGVSHPGYLFHSLMSDHVTAQAVRDAIGSSYPALNDSDVRRLQIFLPKYEEQQRISQVLDTLDTAIHETEAIIVKLNAVKQGLLHDLLTRGIDANGELRPPQAEAPHLYKQSPLGWIPKEWELSTIGDQFDIQLGKMLDDEKNSGILKPYIGNKAVQWDRIDIGEHQQVRLSQSDLIRFRLRKDDLLVCEGGNVGRAAIWDDDLDECYYQKALHRLRPLRGYHPRLMLEMLRYLMGKDALSEYISRTSIAHLPREKLAIVPLPVPEIEEQRRVVTEMLANKQRQEAETQQLRKLQLLKSALMDDLLTGRVRVTPSLTAENTPKSA